MKRFVTSVDCPAIHWRKSDTDSSFRCSKAVVSSYEFLIAWITVGTLLRQRGLLLWRHPAGLSYKIKPNYQNGAHLHQDCFTAKFYGKKTARRHQASMLARISFSHFSPAFSPSAKNKKLNKIPSSNNPTKNRTQVRIVFFPVFSCTAKPQAVTSELRSCII